jgi:hypothetical protein
MIIYGQKKGGSIMRKVWLYLIFASILISLVDWHAVAQQGIFIDGKKDDWKGIPPLIEDENSNLPADDVKAVYAVRDGDNMYVMMEFWGKLSNADYQYYFVQIDLKGDEEIYWEIDLWRGGGNTLMDLTQKPGDWQTAKNLGRQQSISIAANNVVEAKIPLSLIHKPKKFFIKAGVWSDKEKKPVDPTIVKHWAEVTTAYADYTGNVGTGVDSFKSGKASLDAKDFPKAKEELLKSKDAFDKAKQIYPERNLPEQVSLIDEYLSKIEKIMQADTLFTEANNLLNSKDYEASKIKLLAAKKIYEEMGDIPKVSEFDIMLAKIENLLKTKQEADSAFNDAKVAFDSKEFQKARDLFLQAKNKYAQLEDTEKVAQCDDYLKQSEENMKKTGIELLVTVIGLLITVGYLKRKLR